MKNDIYIYEKVHKIRLQIIIGDSKKYIKTVRKYIKDFDYNFIPQIEGKMTMVGGGSAIIYLKTKDIPTLVHELQHYVLRVLTNRGYLLCDDSEEIYCYLLEYFVREVLSKK